MAEDISINLLVGKTGAVAGTGWQEKLRLSSFGALAFLIFSGALVGGVLLVLKGQLATLESQRSQARQAIASQVQKEGLLISLKERTRQASDILKLRKNIEAALQSAEGLTSPTLVSTLSADEQYRLTMTLKLNSLAEASGLVQSLIRETDSKHLAAPKLVSLRLDNEQVVLVVSFLPVL